MDVKDWKIIDTLTENSRLSTQQISKKIGLPVTTVHNRLKKLNQSGTIKKYTVVLDQAKLGLTLPAYILINVEKTELGGSDWTFDKLADKVRKLPGVEESLSVTGVYDLLVKIRMKDVQELNNFLVQLRKIKGIRKTQTGIILSG